MQRVLLLAIVLLAPVRDALAASSPHARERSTAPYVLGAVLIAIVSVALMVQLIVRGKREQRRKSRRP